MPRPLTPTTWRSIAATSTWSSPTRCRRASFARELDGRDGIAPRRRGRHPLRRRLLLPSKEVEMRHDAVQMIDHVEPIVDGVRQRELDGVIAFLRPLAAV